MSLERSATAADVKGNPPVLSPAQQLVNAARDPNGFAAVKKILEDNKDININIIGTPPVPPNRFPTYLIEHAAEFGSFETVQYLIEEKNASLMHPHPLWIFARKNPDKRILQYLTDTTKKIYRRFAQQDITDLHAAIRGENIPEVKRILKQSPGEMDKKIEKCFPADPRGNQFCSTMHLAYHTENLDLINVLKNEFKMDCRDLPHYAAAKSTKLLKYALSEGIPATELIPGSRFGEVAPITHAIDGRNLERIQILSTLGKVNLSAPYPPNHLPPYTNLNRITPAFHAAAVGSLPVLEYLHESKIECTSPSEAPAFQGMTPLYIAAKKGHLDVTKFLVLRTGANPTLPLKKGSDVSKTPLITVAGCQCKTPCNHLEIAKFLYDYSSKELELKDHKKNPFFAALALGNKPLIEFFLSKRPELANIQNDLGNPLALATFNNQHETIKLLLQKGANRSKEKISLIHPITKRAVEIKASPLGTILFFKFRLSVNLIITPSFLETVRILLESDADREEIITAPDGTQHTLFELAKDCPEVLGLLENPIEKIINVVFDDNKRKLMADFLTGSYKLPDDYEFVINGEERNPVEFLLEKIQKLHSYGTEQKQDEKNNSQPHLKKDKQQLPYRKKYIKLFEELMNVKHRGLYSIKSSEAAASASASAAAADNDVKMFEANTLPRKVIESFRTPISPNKLPMLQSILNSLENLDSLISSTQKMPRHKDEKRTISIQKKKNDVIAIDAKDSGTKKHERAEENADGAEEPARKKAKSSHPFFNPTAASSASAGAAAAAAAPPAIAPETEGAAAAQPAPMQLSNN